ncbi:MAG: glycosyltransferase [Flavobacterium sp.]|nr:MAG: glycosyltransferase [Flavobacterium sp.]
MARCLRNLQGTIGNRMIENTPIKKIPLPDYSFYKAKFEENPDFHLPLKPIPFHRNGNLSKIPFPLNTSKKGWPWDFQSDLALFPYLELPKFSVVIPSYQQGKYLEEAIRSVLLQNYANIELIIIDGGSTDSTSEVLEHYRNQISFIVSEKDSGQSQAINKGFSIASGDLYYWLNSDDFLNKNSFNNIVPIFLKNEKIDIVYGHGLNLDALTAKLTLDFAPIVFDRYLRFGGIILSHSVIWRSKIHCKIWEDLECAMDAELWMRLFNDRKIKHCYYPIGVFRKHPEQKTAVNSGWDDKWISDFEDHIWQHYSPIKKLNWRLRELEYKIVQKIHRFLIERKSIK